MEKVEALVHGFSGFLGTANMNRGEVGKTLEERENGGAGESGMGRFGHGGDEEEEEEETESGEDVLCGNAHRLFVIIWLFFLCLSYIFQLVFIYLFFNGLVNGFMPLVDFFYFFSLNFLF